MEVENNEKAKPTINIGKLLIEARDNLALSSGEIAEALNLSKKTIEQIELNNFDQDLPATFIRGYIKSYGFKVGLDPAPLLAEFDRLRGETSPSLIRMKSISKFGKKRKEVTSNHYLFKLFSAVIILVFVVFVGIEIWQRYSASATESAESGSIVIESLAITSRETTSLSSQNNETETETEIGARPVPALEPKVTETTKAIQLNNTLTGQSNISDTVRAKILVTSKIAKTDKIESKKTPQAEQQELVLSKLVIDFTDNCWVRIVDAKGEEIAIGIKPAGKHMVVEGVAPINVVLGDPAVVTMNYNDNQYDLSGYIKGRKAEINLY